MVKREELSREHDELEALADALLQRIAAPEPDYESVGTLRWRMARVLLVHLAKEDRLLYPELRRSPRDEVCTMAGRFADEMGGLAGKFTDYVAAWPMPRAMADWAGFGASTRAVLAALRERIRREEEELYPLIA